MVALEPLVDKGWLDIPALPEPAFDALRVDFARVVPWRMAQLRAAWDGFSERAGEVDRIALADYVADQAHWLEDYALFMALETAHAGQRHWPSARPRPWRRPAPTMRPRSASGNGCSGASTPSARR
jgi:4-alpha-glucanotransferase